MLNEELYEQIKREIPQYQIGFHQISLQKYQDVVNCESVRALEFKIDGENVDEKMIANRIMQKGLQIWDTRRGLCSTSSFHREFKADRLNYKYYSLSQHVCNIIFAVPYFITYEGKSYFLGNLSFPSSIGSNIIFNESIPPEFVYGYYEKESSIGIYPNQYFSENLDFHANDGFWKNLTLEEQKQVLQKIFSNQQKSRALRLANNHRQIELLSCDNLTRFIIKQTRRQKKTYVKGLKH